MSTLGDITASLRRIIRLDDEVQELKQRAGKADDRFLDHERRLTRIETLIEFGSSGSSPRRLPRR